jgi:hypothetical protein
MNWRLSRPFANDETNFTLDNEPYPHEAVEKGTAVADKLS